MAVEPRSFNRLPPKEKILNAIEMQKLRLTDLTSYLWHITPVAERFGDQVYEVAARSLTESGVPTSAAELKALAEGLKTPEGQARYAENRFRHMGSVTRTKLPGGGTLSATGA
jgi:hypothetical protein